MITYWCGLSFSRCHVSKNIGYYLSVKKKFEDHWARQILLNLLEDYPLDLFLICAAILAKLITLNSSSSQLKLEP